jgi:hypothetical protein
MVKKMSKGFLIFSQDTSEKSFSKCAYALALSIKINCPDANVSLVTNVVPPDSFKHIYDKIIDIPWNDNREITAFAAEHRWKMYYCTPYEETIVLDADMLVLDDISFYWDFFKNYNVYYTSNVLDYRGNVIEDKIYRKCFISNHLPNFYSALHYFKKSNEAKEFYDLVQLITNNWELFYGKFVSLNYPKLPSMDVTASLAAKILDKEKSFTLKDSPVTFVHMKPLLQGWEVPPTTWTERVGSYFNDNCELKIGNFKQSGIFHYTEKNFLTDRIVQILEKRFDKNGR